jgi:hypothetical protein
MAVCRTKATALAPALRLAASTLRAATALPPASLVARAVLPAAVPVLPIRRHFSTVAPPAAPAAAAAVKSGGRSMSQRKKKKQHMQQVASSDDENGAKSAVQSSVVAYCTVSGLRLGEVAARLVNLPLVRNAGATIKDLQDGALYVTYVRGDAIGVDGEPLPWRRHVVLFDNGASVFWYVEPAAACVGPLTANAGACPRTSVRRS